MTSMDGFLVGNIPGLVRTPLSTFDFSPVVPGTRSLQFEKRFYIVFVKVPVFSPLGGLTRSLHCPPPLDTTDLHVFLSVLHGPKNRRLPSLMIRAS